MPSAGVLLLHLIGRSGRGSGFGPGLNISIIDYDWSIHGTEQLRLYVVLVLLMLFVFTVFHLVQITGSAAKVASIASVAVPTFAIISWVVSAAGWFWPVAAIACSAALIAAFQRERAARALNAVALVLLGAWFGVYVLLPVFSANVTARSSGGFVFLQEHYAATVLPALDVFGGRYIESGYGHTAFLLGLLQQLLSNFLENVPSIVRVVAVAHTGVVVLSFLIAAVLSRRDFAPILALTILAIPAGLFGVMPALGTPNLSGQRYAPALVGIAAITLHASRNRTRYMGLGVILGALTAISLETGMLAISAGLTYAILRDVDRTPASMARALARVFVPAAASFALARGALWMAGYADNANAGSAGSWLRGFGGATRPLDARAAVIVIAAFAMLMMLVLSRTTVHPVEAVGGGILSAVILQWVVYANRTHVANVWFAVLLFGLAVVAFSRHAGQGRGDTETRLIDRRVFQFGVFALASVAVLSYPIKLLDIGALRCDTVPVYGFCIAGDEGPELTASLAALDEFPRATTAVLSSAPTHVRSMGFNAQLIHSRGVWLASVSEGIRIAAEELNERKVTIVIVQTPGSVLGRANPWATEAFEAIVEQAGSFQLARSTADWSIFVRTEAGAVP